APPDAPRLARHRAFHRSPFSAISALGSSVGRPHLARPRATRLGSHDTEHFTARHFRRFQRSARPSDGLTSHGHARRASARTTISISPLAIFGDFIARLVRRTASPRPATPAASRPEPPPSISPSPP